MSQEFSSADAGNLPEMFPTVSVDLALGEQLKQAGRSIEIDFDSLNQGLQVAGISENALGDVDVAFHYHQGRFADRGEAGPTDDGYDLDISIDRDDIHEGDTDDAQDSLIHEAKHAGDYFDLVERHGTEIAEQQQVFGSRVDRYGKLVSGMYGIAITAQAEGGIGDVHDPISWVKGGAALAVGAVSYFAAGRILYKTNSEERAAIRCADEHADQVPQIVQFPENTEITEMGLNTKIVQPDNPDE
ncbi:MAG TPA: hypothetical protein VHT70_03190 [Candidatus Saccharimonadales bacterium]|jgi:hypothetical protein|nr:hypothetical protein [Candidatus Saccharimonadales bacterium]